MLESAYRLLTGLGGPVIDIYLRRRLARGREDRERFQERLGVASQPRPEGRLVWCHAASVGEAMSLLALIDKMLIQHYENRILITTGTVTSAKILADRLPAGVIHQYMPVDRLPYVRKFLDHWRPDVALWVESELWPNMLSELRARKISAALLNGSLSEKSFRKWYRVKGWARQVMSTFALCIAQTEEDRSRFVALGAKPVRCFGNLKYAAKPLPFDSLALKRMKDGVGKRPLWLMASTHPGEEDMALEAHEKLREQWPEILTIIVPRHPARGEEIAQAIAGKHLSCARRSKGEDVTAETDIYLADTMGELGLFYRLSRIMCMGGTFVPIGGHNIIEAAQLGCAIIFGPYMQEYMEIKKEFEAYQAAIPLQHANEIAFTVNRLLASPETCDKYDYAARVLADKKQNVLVKVMETLKPLLNSPKQPENTAAMKEAQS